MGNEQVSHQIILEHLKKHLKNKEVWIPISFSNQDVSLDPSSGYIKSHEEEVVTEQVFLLGTDPSGLALRLVGRGVLLNMQIPVGEFPP